MTNAPLTTLTEQADTLGYVVLDAATLSLLGHAEIIARVTATQDAAYTVPPVLSPRELFFLRRQKVIDRL